MNWTFCNIKPKKFEDFPKEWVLRLDSDEDLLCYWMDTQPTVVSKAFQHYVKRPNAHFTNKTTMVANIRAEFAGTSFIEALAGFMDDVLKGMIKCLKDGFILYIRSCGSYTIDTSNSKLYNVLETKKRNELVFPTTEDKLKIFKWPQGKHWYATIGNVNVVVNGKQKWTSYDAAERAAKRFLEEENK